ncbi:MAG: MotA/TolQ/ExbB proton channel family protein [Solirubrobacterales bacterium]
MTALPLAESLTTNLADALARIAAALQVPVLLLAVAILIAIAIETGRFAVELWQRRSRAKHGGLRRLSEAAVADPAQAGALSGYAPTSFSAQALLEVASAATRHDPDSVELALTDYELVARRRLDRTRILVRTGPAVGLMGTLIPLAPGLQALADGEIAQLADDLRTAFAATVIGLLVGTLAFALTLTRNRLYSEDLAALERAAAPIVRAAR